MGFSFNAAKYTFLRIPMGSYGPWIFRSHEFIRPTDFGQVGKIFHGLKNAGRNFREDVTLVLQIPCFEGV